MDWFSWLLKAGLHPSLVYEYGVVFSHNELEEEDIVFFNHEFLQSMGISIAKHRLEILKVARKYQKEKRREEKKPITKLMVAIKRTKRNFEDYLRGLVCRDLDRAIVIVPTRHSTSLSGDLLKRSKKKKKMMMMAGSNNNPERLLLTNGSPLMVPVVYDLRKEGNMDGDGDGDDDDDVGDDHDHRCGKGYWASGVAEIRWDTMFQDLKPT